MWCTALASRSADRPKSRTADGNAKELIENHLDHWPLIIFKCYDWRWARMVSAYRKVEWSIRYHRRSNLYPISLALILLPLYHYYHSLTGSQLVGPTCHSIDRPPLGP